MLPPELAAVNVTEYVPAELKTCVGFRSMDVPPSPKFHAQLVGLFVEVSVNVAMKGIVPEVGVAVKDATGVLITAGAEIESTPVLIQPPLEVEV